MVSLVGGYETKYLAIEPLTDPPVAIGTVLYTNPPSIPAAGWQQIMKAWPDTYAAFKGAFDTLQQRRAMPDEYSADARRRLREFNELLLSAAPKAPPAALPDALEGPPEIAGGPWVGCQMCDVSFACYEGKAICIRNPWRDPPAADVQQNYRAVIERAVRIMRGEGVNDQAEAYDQCLKLLDAALRAQSDGEKE